MSILYITEFQGLAANAQVDSNDKFAEPAITTQKLNTAATTGGIATLGAITAGTLYTNGTYLNVPLTGGTGSGATANITVAGAAVTAVTLTSAGSGYTVADALSATAANLGGTGSGFSIPVATISIISAPFNVLTRYIEIECDGTAPASFVIGQFPVVATVSNNRINANERITRGIPAQPVNPTTHVNATPWYMSVVTNT